MALEKRLYRLIFFILAWRCFANVQGDQWCLTLGGYCTSRQGCFGQIVGSCWGVFGSACCRIHPGSGIPLSTFESTDKKCKDRNGRCTQIWACTGSVLKGLCPRSSEYCCVEQDTGSISTADPEKLCKENGGSCIHRWLCSGQIKWGICQAGSGKECCLKPGSAPAIQDPEKKCKDRGGTCQPAWMCIGTTLQNHCRSGSNEECCLPSLTKDPISPDPEKECRDRGGVCEYSWNCAGRFVHKYCSNTGKSCCYPKEGPGGTGNRDPEQKCRDKGGKCVHHGQCNGRMVWSHCGKYSGKGCCWSRDPPSTSGKCEKYGGKCWSASSPCKEVVWPGTVFETSLCEGTQLCCRDDSPSTSRKCEKYGGKCWSASSPCKEVVWPGTVFETSLCEGTQLCCRDDSLSTSGKCEKYGGKCWSASSPCKEVVWPGTVFETSLCEGTQLCCRDDPDKKCKEACGECKPETQCDGHVVSGMCGGASNRKCCFKIDPRTDGACIEKGREKNGKGVCMAISCEGYFVRCNEYKQSPFCPENRRMECCIPAGKEPRAGAQNCRSAGGTCDCNPCDGQFIANRPGKRLCPDTKKCCIVDPFKRCQDRGGHCYRRNVECKGPYLSGFCGNGPEACCFEADFNRIPLTTGASDETTRGQGLNVRRFSGVAASEELVRRDVPHLNKIKGKIEAVASKTRIDAAIIAAIISRETRGGRQHHLNNPLSFGAMQLDTAKKRNDPLSEEHFEEATLHLIAGLRSIFEKHPCWAMETKLRGAIAAYNSGPGNIQSIERMDIGTWNDDYSADVVARARWLKKQGHF